MEQVVEAINGLLVAVKALIDPLDPQLVANVVDAAASVVGLSS